MMKLQCEAPMALVVAGYDPSGGAGVVSDLRAMEQRGVLGQGVVTGNTFQNDLDFVGVEWCEESAFRQLELLVGRAQFGVVKIGLIPSLDFLDRLLKRLERLGVEVPLVWDPILSASAGFDFHAEAVGRSEVRERMVALMERVDLATPNRQEYEWIFGEGVGQLSSPPCDLLVKSALEREGESGREVGNLLLLKSGERLEFWSRKSEGVSKHGSGCVLSSLIAAGLARGERVEKSIERALPLFQRFFLSSQSALGIWRNEELI